VAVGGFKRMGSKTLEEKQRNTFESGRSARSGDFNWDNHGGVIEEEEGEEAEEAEDEEEEDDPLQQFERDRALEHSAHEEEEGEEDPLQEFEREKVLEAAREEGLPEETFEDKAKEAEEVPKERAETAPSPSLRAPAEEPTDARPTAPGFASEGGASEKSGVAESMAVAGQPVPQEVH